MPRFFLKHHHGFLIDYLIHDIYSINFHVVVQHYLILDLIFLVIDQILFSYHYKIYPHHHHRYHHYLLVVVVLPLLHH